MLLKTVVFFLLVAWTTGSTLAQSTKCPQKGKIGASLPDIFQGINPDDGYHIVVKMAGDVYPFTKVDEYYNGATKHGRIQINDGDGYKGISYYSMTNKIFTLDEEKRCEAKKIDAKKKASIVNSWLKSDDLIEALSTSLESNDLSPGALLRYVNSIKDKFQDLSGNGAIVDGQQVNQWFYCINDNGPYIEFNFNKQNQPTNMVLILPDEPEITRTIYFISMEPAIPGKAEPTLYPWGFRCLRPVENSKVVVPTFAHSDAFFMEMEASLFFSSANVSVLGNAKVTKYQGIYSYDLISANQTTRIIYDSLVDVAYRVDSLNGKCTENTASSGLDSRTNFIRWPYAEEEMFNLLNANLFSFEYIEERHGYMGQIHTEFGRMDIFEKTEGSFFRNDDGMYYDALLTYLFPVMEAVGERNQAPLKIIIKPMAKNAAENDPTFLTKLELVFIDYREKNIGNTDLFDISGCYDEPGRYTWFQIVFPDIPSNILQLGAEEELIRSSFDKAISSFIPRLRLPETRISFFGPNIYVTSKLLERPALKYFFNSYNDSTIENPTKILSRENEEECGGVCSEDNNCQQFSYCSNRECLIHNSTTRYPRSKEQVGCTRYVPSLFPIDGASTVEKNLRKTSESLLQGMKLLIEKGLFYLDSPPVSAEKIFIVNGPDDIGGMGIDADEENQFSTTYSCSDW